MRILVAEPLAADGVELLARAHQVDVRTGLPRAELLAALAEYDAVIVRSQVRMDGEAIAAGRRLQVIARAGTGVDNVDVDAATRAGVVVVNAPTGNTIAAAEHTVAMLLALARRIPAADASVRRGEWERARFIGAELRGKTLGIIGLGKIGLAVAERARGLEMEVIGYDPFVTADRASTLGVRVVELPQLLESSDAVSVHVPLTGATRDLIGEAELARMRPGAFVLNVARGGIVDEAALARALVDGRLGGAALDVFVSEPLRGSPLLDAPNTVLTPHLGASTEEAQLRVAIEAAEQVLEVLAGRPARYAVNAPLLTPETEKAVAPFLPLARTLGQFYAQFARRFDDLTLEVSGEIAAHDAQPLVAAALSGLLGTVSEERVNVVNAAHIARSRGISLAERRRPNADRYPSLLTIAGSASVSGTVAADGEPRVVRLGEYWVDIPPASSMLVTRHRDRPGTMGRIGLMLGESDVNISGMHLARASARGDALMVLALDDPVPAGVAERIRREEAVLDLWVIRLE